VAPANLAGAALFGGSGGVWRRLAKRPLWPDDGAMTPQEVSDRLEILDLLARYGLAVDSGDWSLFDTVFTADALIDHSSTGGVKGDREEVSRWLAEILPTWPGRQHLIGTATIRVEGDEATVSAPYTDTLSPSRDMISASEKGLLRGGGWYHHRLTRTPEGWRSRELVNEQTWRTAT
jgi:SnoaL-like domain